VTRNVTHIQVVMPFLQVDRLEVGENGHVVQEDIWVNRAFQRAYVSAYGLESNFARKA
jgi:hypothetical protein